MNDIAIIAENLSVAETMLSEGWEVHYAQLRELTNRFWKQGASREQIAEDYRALASAVKHKRDEKSDTPSTAIYPELDLHSRLMIAREWAAVVDPMPLAVISADGCTIAHFSNLYADRAFTAFSEILGTTSVYSSEDYTAACEEVSEGNADFCILPIESARDGVMDRFEQLIDRYSLFVLMTCTLWLSEENEEDSGEWIRFALLASSPCQFKADGQPAADRIQFRITPEGEALWELLLAADLLGAKLLECAQCRGRSERASVYRLTFSADEQIRSGLLAYLELGYSRYALIGAYRQIPDLRLNG